MLDPAIAAWDFRNGDGMATGDPPSPRTLFCSAEIDGTIYIHGGTGMHYDEMTGITSTTDPLGADISLSHPLAHPLTLSLTPSLSPPWADRRIH